MYLDEVVGEVRQGDGCDMILKFLREGISQSREPARRHPHAKVVPLDVAGVDVLRVGLADDCMTLAPDTDRWAIPLLRFFWKAVNLHELGIVDIARERLVYCLDVDFQSITCKLDAIRETARKVFDEVTGAFRIALANQPARYQLGIGVNRGPQPRIACAWILRRDVFRNGLLFAVAKGPAFINLHAFALEVLEDSILAVGTERANLEDQAHDGFFGRAGYANGRTDGVSFDQATDDLGALFGSEPVHTSSMPDGSRSVKTFEKDSAKKLGYDQDALRLAQRALAAFRALRRRCSGVMLSARRLPPILPPSRPSSDRIWERSERAGCSGTGSLGRSPSNLCTAMKPAWTSSSGSLPDGFRIHLHLGTFGRFASSLWKTKVAHYPNSGPWLAN